MKKKFFIFAHDDCAMSPLVFVLIYSFLLGLRKGSIVCVGVCSPALIIKAKDCKSPIRASIEFNTPRVLLLSMAGAFVGFLGYTTAYSTGINAMLCFSTIAYTFLAIMFIAYAMYTVAKIMGDEHGEQSKSNPSTPPLYNLLYFFLAPVRKFFGRRFYAYTGITLSIICMGESLLTIEMLAILGATSSFSHSSLAASLIGASVMFLFAIGTSIPVTIIIFGADRIKNKTKLLEKIRLVTALAMMAVGISLLYLIIFRIEFLYESYIM
ncbi:MAG: hypothetical protein DRN20_06695 [Thermoplasmata archaeon]|nr:MAG: hypothetical protein DRN20_06695 [Thermoplasmata archaeon]